MTHYARRTNGLENIENGRERNALLALPPFHPDSIDLVASINTNYVQRRPNETICPLAYIFFQLTNSDEAKPKCIAMLYLFYKLCSTDVVWYSRGENHRK